MPGATVLRGSMGSEVRSWSKIYVPLIYCAIGKVPRVPMLKLSPFLSAKQRVSAPSDIAKAKAWWAERLSPWDAWCDAIRSRLLRDETDEIAFVERYLEDAKGKTTAVFNDGHGYGWLPHPLASHQEAIMQIAGIDGEIALCVLAATAKEAPLPRDPVADASLL